jgi:hypothetical protein
MVGLITASIGAVGAITAAVISSSSGGGSTTPTGGILTTGGLTASPGSATSPFVAIGSVSFRNGTRGEVVTVIGTVRGLPPGDVVYAVAKPQSITGTGRKPSIASPTASLAAEAPGTSRWFASTGSDPTASGMWIAIIVIVPPPTFPLTIQAVTLLPTAPTTSETETASTLASAPETTPLTSAATATSTEPVHTTGRPSKRQTTAVATLAAAGAESVRAFLVSNGPPPPGSGFVVSRRLTAFPPPRKR